MGNSAATPPPPTMEWPIRRGLPQLTGRGNSNSIERRSTLALPGPLTAKGDRQPDSQATEEGRQAASRSEKLASKDNLIVWGPAIMAKDVSYTIQYEAESSRRYPEPTRCSLTNVWKKRELGDNRRQQNNQTRPPKFVWEWDRRHKSSQEAASASIATARRDREEAERMRQEEGWEGWLESSPGIRARARDRRRRVASGQREWYLGRPFCRISLGLTYSLSVHHIC